MAPWGFFRFCHGGKVMVTADGGQVWVLRSKLGTRYSTPTEAYWPEAMDRVVIAIH
jgi:hypothetical protein